MVNHAAFKLLFAFSIFGWGSTRRCGKGIAPGVKGGQYRFTMRPAFALSGAATPKRPADMAGRWCRVTDARHCSKTAVARCGLALPFWYAASCSRVNRLLAVRPHPRQLTLRKSGESDDSVLPTQYRRAPLCGKF